MQVAKELAEVEVASAMHSRRRIVVLVRDDGNFTYAEQYHHLTEQDGRTLAEGWVTLPAFGIFASAEAAEAAGREVMDRWLRRAD